MSKTPVLLLNAILKYRYFLKNKNRTQSWEGSLNGGQEFVILFLNFGFFLKKITKILKSPHEETINFSDER